jgi:hypothetical protein
MHILKIEKTTTLLYFFCESNKTHAFEKMLTFVEGNCILFFCIKENYK